MTTFNSVGKMTVLAVLGATVLASSTRSIAAPNADGTPKREWKNGGKAKGNFGAQKLAAKLNLSEAQKSQIQSISTRARADAQAVKGNADLSPEQKSAQLKTIRTNAREAINGVLTPSQREHLQQMRQQTRKEGRGKRGIGRGGDGTRFAQKLGLSLSQQTQIKTIRQRAQTDIQAVRGNTTLSKEDKRAQLNTIRSNVQSAISAVLTSAQREQWQAMKSERKDKREANRGERKANRRERKANRNNGLNS